jgi:hypothetical protein
MKIKNVFVIPLGSHYHTPPCVSIEENTRGGEMGYVPTIRITFEKEVMELDRSQCVVVYEREEVNP